MPKTRTHEDKYMVSSRKLSRREFCTNFPLLISAAWRKPRRSSEPPKQKFNLGDRVVSRRLCDDDRSPNYGGIDWEKGYIVGCCWNYDEWLRSEYQQGWTYFIRFDESNNPSCFTQPWLDFEHEKNLALV